MGTLVDNGVGFLLSSARGKLLDPQVEPFRRRPAHIFQRTSVSRFTRIVA